MVRIYHNKRCSKSRAALALLEDRGVAVEIVNYLDTPPDASQLSCLIAQLGNGARTLLRPGEPVYRELGLDNPALSENELIAAMVAHPILIERPIVVAGSKAVIGRPAEAVLSIL